MWYHCARYVKDPGDVGVEDGLYVVVLEHRQQVVTDNAAVIHEHIDAVAAGRHPLNGCLTRLAVADIDLLGRDSLACGPARGNDFIGDFCAVTIEKGDVSPFHREKIDACAPDAAGPPCNDYRFVRESGGLKHRHSSA